MNNIKRVVILPGDPTGVGPEIVCKCLNTMKSEPGIACLLVGDERIIRNAEKICGLSLDLKEIESINDARSGQFSMLNFQPVDISDLEVGKRSVPGGESVLRSLEFVLPFVNSGAVDGIVFAPFNKQAMHESGWSFNNELEYLADYFAVEGIPGEINIINNIWAVRITSHIALKDVSTALTIEKVLRGIEFLNLRLQEAGIHRPRLCIAGLNPHNGEDGLFGDEEGRIIEPAIKMACAKGILAEGPFPADTMFLRLRKEHFDGIVGMYHDQLQIGLKLMGFDTGVTLLGGLPVPIATAAHGTAFDIAGKGVANHLALETAINTVRKIILRK